MGLISDEAVNRWIELAKLASAKAYAPYSRFRVGAVVISDSGSVYAGCNVENASYGLTCCAERSAVFHMAAGGETRIACVVIYTPTDKPTAPCGACRQVINEFTTDARIISACDGKDRINTSIDQLLPGAFGPHNLT